jgi:hypothetical protein
MRRIKRIGADFSQFNPFDPPNLLYPRSIFLFWLAALALDTSVEIR